MDLSSFDDKIKFAVTFFGTTKLADAPRNIHIYKLDSEIIPTLLGKDVETRWIDTYM